MRSPLLHAPDPARVIAATLALLTYSSTTSIACADTIVNFWLSNDDAGPAAPVIYAPPGSINDIQVWARPASNQRLTAFALNLLSATPNVIAFENIEVRNPIIPTEPPRYRHQLIFDTPTGLVADLDFVNGFLGFSFFPDASELPEGAGIGPSCGLDPDCSPASGDESWHIATVRYEAGLSYGSTELFLEISTQGISQRHAFLFPPADPTDTSAYFGFPNDVLHEWDVDVEGEVYDTDHRNMHFGVADAVIHVATADFDQDGDVDGADFVIWQRGAGVGSTLEEGDANGDGEVDSVDLAAWRYQYGLGAEVVAAGAAVPEPSMATLVLGLFVFSLTRSARTPPSRTVV